MKKDFLLVRLRHCFNCYNYKWKLVDVDRLHRGVGVGKGLMSYVEEYAKERNCSYIMLITDSDRVSSQVFYKSLGYNTEEYCAFKKHL